MEIEFRDPPARAGAPARVTTYQRLRRLTERPGEWAVIHNLGSSASAASFVRRVKRDPSCRPPGTFEFTVRSLEDGRAEVYAIAIEKAEVK